MATDTDSLLLRTPPPIITELALYTPAIKGALAIARLLSWHTAYKSFILLFAWWGVCLFSWPIYRWAAPVLLLLTLGGSGGGGDNGSHRRNSSTALNEDELEQTLEDLRALRTLLPISIVPTSGLSAFQAIRIIVFVYVPYQALVFFVPPPIIFGVIGTLVLTVRAPWMRVIGHSLWRSAYIRQTAYLIGRQIAGGKAPVKQTPPSSSMIVASAAAKEAEKTVQDGVRFQITIAENQRWWVGLDWTAATLPSERPPWSSVTAPHAPLDPPSGFELPSDTPTARWRWTEDEWKADINPTGEGGANETDKEGWLYGDNKWGNNSPKNGMGKYTRTRRWIREAVLHSESEPTGPIIRRRKQ